jgi:hypothetical protein
MDVPLKIRIGRQRSGCGASEENGRSKPFLPIRVRPDGSA